MLRPRSFLILLWSLCSWCACTSPTECDVEGLRCEVICSFPDLTLHCTRCLNRRPMRFGKRSKRSTDRSNALQLDSEPLLFSQADPEYPGSFEHQRLDTLNDISSSFTLPAEKHQLSSTYSAPFWLQRHYSSDDIPSASLDSTRITEDPLYTTNSHSFRHQRFHYSSNNIPSTSSGLPNIMQDPEAELRINRLKRSTEQHSLIDEILKNYPQSEHPANAEKSRRHTHNLPYQFLENVLNKWLHSREPHEHSNNTLNKRLNEHLTSSIAVKPFHFGPQIQSRQQSNRFFTGNQWLEAGLDKQPRGFHYNRRRRSEAIFKDLSHKPLLPSEERSNKGADTSKGYPQVTKRSRRSVQQILEELMVFLGLEELPVDPSLYGCQEVILPFSKNSYIVLNTRK